MQLKLALASVWFVLGLQLISDAAEQSASVIITWGHTSTRPRDLNVSIAAGNAQLDETSTRLPLQRDGDRLTSVIAKVRWNSSDAPPRKPHSIWEYLLANGTPGQVSRLKDDPGLTPEAATLTVALAEDMTRGFTIGLEQLLRHKAMWLPEQDAFVTLADAPVDFKGHVTSLRGERVLASIKREPEASWREWTNKWEDIGNPLQWSKPWETSLNGARGHLTGLAARHLSLCKFGIDRWCNIRPDLGSPSKFRFDFDWSGYQWVSQRIPNGLPIVITELSNAGQKVTVEQFAARSTEDSARNDENEGPDALLTQIRMKGAGPLRFGFRFSSESTNGNPQLRRQGNFWEIKDTETGATWLSVNASPGIEVKATGAAFGNAGIAVEIARSSGDANSNATVTFRQAAIPNAGSAAFLTRMDHEQARAKTVQYWEQWLRTGALFESPEPEVNALFRANLWHALILPRAQKPGRPVAFDLPYSNFAYGQKNADWPINQAVYVDYMLYGLRGHFQVAEDEFASMFQTQQKNDGRISGYAEWGVYSPGILYSIGQNYLLSDARESFARLLPAALKTLDWCLAEVARGQTNELAPGLIVAPLNDLTHDARAWAFPNAYFVAGLDVFGRALEVYGHPRAGEVRAAASKMRADVERAFARAAVRSPVVQLADGTWINYVPCDAMTPRRLLDAWYPTDVDCGPLHLVRLLAVDPRGWLATAMLHDHEDNLFLNQWGMANEPVYNQHATAYLLRDDPAPAIRAFYSMMACAFSHHQLTPLEHRWAWGQYYMPPSTDGAWFDLYRHMLIREKEDDTLVLCAAMPRQWLAPGKRLRVERAPTYFGRISFEMAAGRDEATLRLDAPGRRKPKAIWIKFREPGGRSIRSATLNGKEVTNLDLQSDSLRISSPAAGRYTVRAKFQR